MVKLAVADTSSLFNFQADVGKKDDQEELKKTLQENDINFDPNKNIEDTVVDAYLMHFLKEMDQKTILSSRMLQNLITGKSSNIPDIPEMGKLESMRQVMKMKPKYNVDNASDAVNTGLGNAVKQEIIKTKKKRFIAQINEDEDVDTTSEAYEKQVKQINPEDVSEYNGIVDVKYLQYANDDDGDNSNPNENKANDNENNSLDKVDQDLIEMNDSLSEDDQERPVNSRNNQLNINGNDFATISERPEEEFEDNESKLEKDRKREIKEAIYNSKKQNKDSKNKKKKKKDKDKDKEKDKDKYKNAPREEDEEKNYKIYEFDLVDNNMQFKTHKAPTLIKTNVLGHSLWLSSIIYIPEKNLIVTGGYNDYKVKIWRINKKTFSMNKIGEYKGHSGHITMLSYIPTREYLLTGSQDCSFAVLSLKKIKYLTPKEERKDALLEESGGSVAEIENSNYGSLVKGDIKELFVGKKKFWNKCMLYKLGKKDLLVTCFMKKVFTTDLTTFKTTERIKVFEPITNILELKKNHYLFAMTEHMVIFDLRNKVKIGKNYREHKIIKDYNLIELEYIKERKLLMSAGCDGLLVLWRVCEKNEFDESVLEAQTEEIPHLFLMKIQKVKFHSDKFSRIFSVVYVRFENKIVLCNEGNRLYVFSFEKKKQSKGLLKTIEILNARYICKNLDNPISGIYNLEDFGQLITYHWKEKSINFVKLEE